MSDEHQSFIKSPRQLIVVVALAFIVPVVVIMLFATLVSTTTRTGAGADSASAEAIEERLRPVGRLVFTGEEGAGAAVGAASTVAAAAAAAPGTGAAPVAPAGSAAPGAATSTATQAAAGAGADGEKIYKASCALCHDTGVANAPKYADEAAWKPRIDQGIDTLKKHAIEGIRGMPPRGGNASLSDAQVGAAVDYIVAGSK